MSTVSTVHLRETPSNQIRYAIFQDLRQSPGAIISGVVEVHERKTPGSQDIMYRYALAEITKDDAIGRSFRLLKPLEARQKRDDGPYYVHLSFTDPKYDRCVCTGFDAHGHCKHVDALRALHTEGKFS